MKTYIKLFHWVFVIAMLVNGYHFMKFVDYGIRTPGVTWSEGWFFAIIPLLGLAISLWIDYRVQKEYWDAQ